MKNFVFENPCDIYRGLDLWMVNDRLSHEEIARQVREFKDKGLYSVIFRTYDGLTSDYPGVEFKSKLATAVKTAKECGLKIVLQAGFMPAAIPDLPECCALHKIVPMKKEKLTGEEKILAVYDGICYTDAVSPCCLNMLDKTAVDYYLKMAYEDMWSEFSGEYGKTIISVWVDEPRFDNRYLTWTPALGGIFEKRYGYSLEENIPSLYHDIGDCKKIRYHYFTLLREIMENTYYSGVRDWCHGHHLTFSGHLMAEERLQMQISQSVAVMPFYKYFDIPGIDNLRCNHDWYDKPLKSQTKWHEIAADRARFMGAVQCVSAAEQAGKKHVLCEMYGVTSPGFVFRDMMHMFDFFASHGINHQCMHALFYSPRGFRKRFYPQSFNVYQPFWDNFKNIKDYVARVSSFISMGKCTKDVLVLHPLETAYGLYRALSDVTDESARDVVVDYDNRYYKFITDLYAGNYSWHLGDLATIEQLGSVCGNSFVIGEMAYKTVVISEIELITSKMYELLVKFSHNGGKIIVQGELPSRIDGEYRENLGKELLALPNTQYFENKEQLLYALGKLEKKYRLLCEDDMSETSVNHRTDGNINYFMVFNGSCRKSKKYTLIVNGTHKAFGFDAEHNTVKEIYCNHTDGKTEIPFDAAVGGSVLIFTEPGKKCGVKELQGYSEIPVKMTECSAVDQNVLTLEICTYKTAKMADFTPKDIAVERVTERLKREKYYGEVALRFKFYSEYEAKGLILVMENPELYSVRFNGHDVDMTDAGSYYSEAFRKIILPDATRTGENLIELTVSFAAPISAPIGDTMKHLFELFRTPVGMHLERIHILGDFSVDVIPENPTGAGIVRYGKYFFMTDRKEITSFADITSSGYPFYPGKVLYSGRINATEKMLECSDALIKIGRFNGCSAKVTVNGKVAGFIDREPYELSVKDYLAVGENTVETELCGTFRNMFGPSHYEGADSSGCNRDLWFDSYDKTDCTEYDSGTLTNSFQLVPYGIGDVAVKMQN